VRHVVVTLQIEKFNRTFYGPQVLDIGPTTLTPKLDPENESYGYAYYFKGTYNKTVLLREEVLGSATDFQMPPDDMAKPVEIGDYPWRCTFDNVEIEGYIYVSQIASKANNFSTLMESLPMLPYVVKISESRMPGRTQPYCQQVIMEENDNLVLIPPGDIFKLSEARLVPRNDIQSALARVGNEKRQQPTLQNMCECRWMVQ
jgi:hypothetical protein